MTTIAEIDTELSKFFQSIDRGEDSTRTIMLFAGGSASPLAVALANHAEGIARRAVEVQAVFADARALEEFASRLEIGQREGAGEIRCVRGRQFGDHNEQLVLGTSSFLAGPTIARARNQASAYAVDVSDSKQEIAVATFAFEMLWGAANGAKPTSPVRGGSGAGIALLGTIAVVGGKLLQ